MRNITQQRVCVKCLHLQYRINVAEFSAGRASCTWCGEVPEPMTTKQYQRALRQARVNARQED
jgi:hypothetical protein